VVFGRCEGGTGSAGASDSRVRDDQVMEASPLGPFVYAKKGHEAENLAKLRAETWRAMEDSLRAGKCRAIGVSNFTVSHLEELRKTAVLWPPAVNQVELHPYSPQKTLRAYCASHGIVVQAYGSLGGQDAGAAATACLGGPLLRHPAVLKVAARHAGATAAGVLLRWATQQGVAVVPKSSAAARMAENLAAAVGSGGDGGGAWSLDAADMAALDELDQSTKPESRLCWRTDPLKHLAFE